VRNAGVREIVDLGRAPTTDNEPTDP
jgi:hypothetical protein